MLCGFVATRAVRGRAATTGNRVGSAVAWTVVFASCFFGTFLALGLVDLVAGRPVLRLPVATAVMGVVAAAILLRGSSVASLARGGTALGRAVRSWGELSAAERMLSGATAFVFLILAIFLCAEFPKGYEPRAYHLPVAEHIFRTGGLRPWDREYMDALPANASLYYGFLLRALPERAVEASDLVLLVPLVFSLYALGRATGADRGASLLVACGILTIPIIAFSAVECGADVGGVAFLAAAAYFAIGGEAGSSRDALLAGLASGIAYGFKSVHAVSAVFLLAVVVGRAWSSARCPDAGWRRAARAGAVYGAGLLALSGVWLLRGWMEFRNPVYPIHIGRLSDAVGWSKAPDVNYVQRRGYEFEWVRHRAEWLLYPWLEWHRYKENFKHSSGLGAFFAAALPPAFLAALLAASRSGTKRRGTLAALLAGASVVVAVWWILGDRQPRYLLGAIDYGAPLAAWALASVRVSERRALEWIWAASAVFMLSIVFARQGVEFGLRMLHAGQWTRYRFYNYPPVVDVLPEGARIVNLVGRPDNWPLFGRTHRNEVVNSRRALRELGAPEQEAPPSLVHLDAEVLRRLGATHLFVLAQTRLQLDAGIELSELGRSVWARTDPSNFSVLYRIRYR